MQKYVKLLKMLPLYIIKSIYVSSETEAPLNKPSQTFGIGSHSITWKEKIASYLEPTKESKLDEKLEKRVSSKKS